MNEIVELLYFKKRRTASFQYALPSNQEQLALENFDDTLTEEQRKLFELGKNRSYFNVYLL